MSSSRATIRKPPTPSASPSPKPPPALSDSRRCFRRPLGIHHEGRASLGHVLKTVTYTPREILGLESGTLTKGAPADLVLIDLDEPFVVSANHLRSRARNTPFDGRRMQGRAQATFVGGECVFDRRKEAKR